jgi:recombination protein RecT
MAEYQRNQNYSRGSQSGPRVDVAANLQMIRQALEQARPDMIRVAPRNTVLPESLIEQAVAACAESYKLSIMAPEKVAKAVLNCAQIGLSLDPLFGQAFLEARYSRKARCYNCRLGIGYRGHIALILRTGLVTAVVARIIYENDAYDIDMGVDKISHKPLLVGDRGAPIAGYARADFPNGRSIYELLTRKDLDEIRAMAASRDEEGDGGGQQRGGQQKGPWYTWPDEMDKKSCINRLRKYLPVSTEMQLAATFDAEEYEDDTAPAQNGGTQNGNGQAQAAPVEAPTQPATQTQRADPPATPATTQSAATSKPAPSGEDVRKQAREFVKTLPAGKLQQACEAVKIKSYKDLANGTDEMFRQFNDACRKVQAA